MSTDFVNEIKKAESKARKIVEQAEVDAKNKLEYTKRELSDKLDSVRLEYDQKMRSEKSAAESKSEQYLSDSLNNISYPPVSDELKEQVADQVLERIVDFLGNS